jgi:hypothetical protein
VRHSFKREKEKLFFKKKEENLKKLKGDDLPAVLDVANGPESLEEYLNEAVVPRCRAANEEVAP